MMELKMAKCIKCGSESWSIIERTGALGTWRCDSCGGEETVHVFDPASEPMLPENLEPVFRITGRWVSKPSTQQISEIQTLFPMLRTVPVSALLRKAVEKTDVELGRFTESEMRKLAAKLQRLGMETSQTPINLEKRG
ncbi:MAG: hypothetical protein ABW202_23635 [Duganella sp.]